MKKLLLGLLGLLGAGLAQPAAAQSTAPVAAPTQKLCLPSNTIVGYSVACPSGTASVQKICPYGQVVPYTTKCPTTPPPPAPTPCPDGSSVIPPATCSPPPPPPPPPPPTTSWNKCADENAICYVKGTANVRYGAGTKWTAPRSVTGSIVCSNGVFGDPIYGTAKTCQTDGEVGAPPPPPPPPAPTPVTCPDGSTVIPPATCPPPMPMPPPPTAGYVPAPTVDGLAAIADNFTIANGLVKYSYGAPGTPDNVGAFRFICGAGQVLADDPIVYPGQPGKSHLHQFYGNTGANAFSDYNSLRTTGKSTCSGPDFPLNRSAYWMPAMLDGNGNVVLPDYITVYYKRFPKSSGMCGYMRSIGGDCVMQPNGLRWIIGRNMSNWNAPMLGAFHWMCSKGSGAVLHKVTGDSGTYPLLGDVTSFCTVGWNITLAFDAADCWDGKNLDTPDHQSHMANAKWVFPNGHSFDGCPASHPFRIPVFRLSASYPVKTGDDASKWDLSCSAMAPAGSPRGACAHLDLFDAWGEAKKTWTDNCIDKLLPYDKTKFPNYAWAWAFPDGMGPVSASGGDLCDGTGLKGAGVPWYGWTNPTHLWPIAKLPLQQPPLP